MKKKNTKNASPNIFDKLQTYQVYRLSCGFLWNDCIDISKFPLELPPEILFQIFSRIFSDIILLIALLISPMFPQPQNFSSS